MRWLYVILISVTALAGAAHVPLETTEEVRVVVAPLTEVDRKCGASAAQLDRIATTNLGQARVRLNAASP